MGTTLDVNSDLPHPGGEQKLLNCCQGNRTRYLGGGGGREGVICEVLATYRGGKAIHVGASRLASARFEH